jgi:hypothetical protein
MVRAPDNGGLVCVPTGVVNPRLSKMVTKPQELPTLAITARQKGSIEKHRVRKNTMANKITVYPSCSHQSSVVSDKSAAKSYGFPELSDPTEYGRNYPDYPPVGFAESVVAFLRNAMHRK